MALSVSFFFLPSLQESMHGHENVYIYSCLIYPIFCSYYVLCDSAQACYVLSVYGVQNEAVSFHLKFGPMPRDISLILMLPLPPFFIYFYCRGGLLNEKNI